MAVTRLQADDDRGHLERGYGGISGLDKNCGLGQVLVIQFSNLTRPSSPSATTWSLCGQREIYGMVQANLSDLRSRNLVPRLTSSSATA